MKTFESQCNETQVVRLTDNAGEPARELPADARQLARDRVWELPAGDETHDTFRAPAEAALWYADAPCAAPASEVEQLRRSNSELLAFASNLAHDLRSPLMAIELSLVAIKPGSSDRVTARSLAQARRGLEQMAKLISAMLVHAQLGGESALTQKRCDCEAAFTVAVEAVRAQIASTRAVVTHDRLPVIAGDQTLFTRILQNLFENSIKYCGGAPRVHITAEMIGAAWLFSVTDNGIGIPEEYRQLVFSPLFRGARPHSARPGAGLGLAICRRIVEQHRGRIWVDSVAGEGSVFHFTMPADGPPVFWQAHVACDATACDGSPRPAVCPSDLVSQTGDFDDCFVRTSIGMHDFLE